MKIKFVPWILLLMVIGCWNKPVDVDQHRAAADAAVSLSYAALLGGNAPTPEPTPEPKPVPPAPVPGKPEVKPEPEKRAPGVIIYDDYTKARDAHIKFGSPLLVVITGENCVWCDAQKRMLKDAVETGGLGALDVVFVDRGARPKLTNAILKYPEDAKPDYGIPTLVFFRTGENGVRRTGYMNKERMKTYLIR